MTIQLARTIGNSLGVRSETRIRTLDAALRQYVRSVPQSPLTPISGNFDASQVTSGTFADARVAESNVTQHEAALDIDWTQLLSVPSTFPPEAHTHAESEIVDGSILARLAANETISGLWSFSAGRVLNGAAEISWQAASIADDGTQVFAVPDWGIAGVVMAAGGVVNRNGLFWYASSSETTALINGGANFSLGTTTNPDVDGNVNAWMSGAGQLSIKNRFGSTRTIAVLAFGRD